MREKYVDERWPRLMQLGSASDGKLGVCTVDDRVDVLLSPEDAEKLIAEWNRMQDALAACALAFDEAAPEAFSAHWYGKVAQ